MLAFQNHADVLVVVDPEDYPALVEHLQGKGDVEKFRKHLAWKAFQMQHLMIQLLQSGCGSKRTVVSGLCSHDINVFITQII